METLLPYLLGAALAALFVVVLVVVIPALNAHSGALDRARELTDARTTVLTHELRALFNLLAENSHEKDNTTQATAVELRLIRSQLSELTSDLADLYPALRELSMDIEGLQATRAVAQALDAPQAPAKPRAKPGPKPKAKPAEPGEPPAPIPFVDPNQGALPV